MKKLKWWPLLTIIVAVSCNKSFEEDSFLSSLDGNMSAKIYSYQLNKVDKKFDFIENEAITDNGAIWSLSSVGNKKEKGAKQYEITFRNGDQPVTSAGVALEFQFKNWNPENYIMAPAAVYNANRYRVLPVPYPPYIYDEKDRGENMPITITDVPHLNDDLSAGRIDMLSSNCATPMVTFFNKELKRGFILLTEEETPYGLSGFVIEEDPVAKEMKITLAAPGVREKRQAGTSLSESSDRAIDWNKGDSVSLKVILYNFEAKDLRAFYEKVFDVRKDLSGETEYKQRTPYSENIATILNHHDLHKWSETEKYGYIVNRVAPGNYLQVGWGGHPNHSMPFAIEQTSERVRRLGRSFDAIKDMQGKSGLFYGIFRDGELYGDNFDKREEIPYIAMIRKSGLTLYFGLQEFELMRAANNPIDPSWEDMLRRCADGLVKLWNDYGEFGQFVNVETGELEIRKSTAGAICIGALTLASNYYNEPKYLEVAQSAARYYCDRDLALGYTGGGPAEILQCPDSESAAELAESLITLYEATGDKQWLSEAEFAAQLFATWVVSYDFNFPKGSVMSNIDAKSTGSVWASVQNAHSAPGIYVLSGDFLLKLFRATQDDRYAELLKDIVHNVVQYVTTPENQASPGAFPGSMTERVNLSDWEGTGGVGGSIGWGDSNMAWEVVGLLSMMQNPGIYIQTDGDKFLVNDHVDAKIIERSNGVVKIEITNPTKFDAKVRVFAETKEDSKKALGHYACRDWPSVEVKAGEAVTATFGSR